jgi:hypothetical protein
MGTDSIRNDKFCSILALLIARYKFIALLYITLNILSCEKIETESYRTYVIN